MSTFGLEAVGHTVTMNMKARDVMTWGVIPVEPDAPVTRAAQIMLESKISGLPVVDGTGKLVGIVTEGDFLRLATEDVRAFGRKVGEIMTASPYTATEDTPLAEIVKLMERHRIKRVPIVADGKAVGIVSRANLLHALVSLAHEAKRKTPDDAAIRAKIMGDHSIKP